MSSLSIDQQARAARAYFNAFLAKSDQGNLLLNDEAFDGRLDYNFLTIFALFAELYGHRNDCLDQFCNLLFLAGRSWQDRPTPLQKLDKERELNPQWYATQTMLGGVCYVDRYAGNLQGIRAKIPYFKELGLTYLHLMPLFKVPEPLNDGGYAVSSYREVNPKLGTMDDLRILSQDLREAGISLVLDLVFNHTSNEHAWALKARAGDLKYSDYYWIFSDRNIPSAFERTTREIFPDDHPGSFIQLHDGRWVWSSFFKYQVR